VERYGVDEVAQWPLEVWNEPNLVAFWTGGQAKYFELYQATWNAVKALSPRLQVGGPATAANGWLDDFNRFCEANGCRADFISTHYYPTDAFGAIDSDTVSQLAHAPPGVLRERAREARGRCTTPSGTSRRTRATRCTTAPSAPRSRPASRSTSTTSSTPRAGGPSATSSRRTTSPACPSTAVSGC
jgi:hypothetical protein